MKCYKKWWLAVVLGIFIVIVNSFIVFGQDECANANGFCSRDCSNDIIQGSAGEYCHTTYAEYYECCCLENYKSNDANDKCIYSPPNPCLGKPDNTNCGINNKCVSEKCVPPCDSVPAPNKNVMEKITSWTIPDNAEVLGWHSNGICFKCNDYYSWDLQKCVKLIKCGKEPAYWGENIGDGCVQAYLSDKNAQVVGGQGATMYCQMATGYSASECVKCDEGYGLISPNYVSIGCEPIIKSGSCDAAGGKCVKKNTCSPWNEVEEGYPYVECNSYKYDPYKNECKKCEPEDYDYEDCVNYYEKCVCCCQEGKKVSEDKNLCVVCEPGRCNPEKTDYCNLNGSGWIPKSSTETECNDGIDNDCDGKTDSYDIDCKIEPAKKLISRRCYTGGTETNTVDWCAAPAEIPLKIVEDDTAECHEPLYGAVYNQKCYEKDPYNFNRIFHKDIKSSGDDKSAFSLNGADGGVWYDCDNHENDCKICSGSNAWSNIATLTATNGYLVCGQLGNCWIKSGESSAHGEYITKDGCCGDDDNEYFITASWSDEGAINQACCDKSSDCVDKDGTCVSQGEQNKAKTHNCVGYGGWLVSCPNVAIGTINAGCRTTINAKYADSIKKHCPDIHQICYQCIEGTLWNGVNCVPTKSDWLGYLGACGGSKCYCNKNIEECKKGNFAGAGNSEENSPIGEEEGLCVPSDQYTKDYYCKDGEWTTRTAFIATELLNYAKSKNDYVLYCDEYKKTLNKYDVLEKEKNKDKFNNFCVLKTGDEVAFGSSLNGISISDTSTEDLKIFSAVDCSNVGNEQKFVACIAPSKGAEKLLYWNPAIKSFIYGINFNPSIKTEIWDFIKQFFRNPLEALRNLIDLMVGAESKLNYNQVYLNKEGNKKINATYIKIPREKFEIVYTNFDTDICEVLPKEDTICNKIGNSYYVHSYKKELWNELTSNLRIK